MQAACADGATAASPVAVDAVEDFENAFAEVGEADVSLDLLASAAEGAGSGESGPRPQPPPKPLSEARTKAATTVFLKSIITVDENSPLVVRVDSD